MIVEGPGGIGRSRLLEHVGARFAGTMHRLTCLPTDSEYDLLAATRLAMALTGDRSFVAGISARSLFAGIVDALTAGGPTLLVVDDIQFADPASAAVIASVAQHGVTVLAARLVGVVDSSSAKRGAQSAQRGVESVVRLGRLTRTDIDRLPLDGAWHETGGHPGLLGVCLHAHRRQQRDDGDGRSNTARLDAEAIRSILGWVGPDGSLQRDVLGVAATLHPCSIDLLAGALGLSTAMTTTVVADAKDLGLVKMRKDGTVTFRSDLLRRVLEATRYQ